VSIATMTVRCACLAFIAGLDFLSDAGSAGYYTDAGVQRGEVANAGTARA